VVTDELPPVPLAADVALVAVAALVAVVALVAVALDEDEDEPPHAARGRQMTTASKAR
jgi:hypothetical protein